jgi:hypothetical protein
MLDQANSGYVGIYQEKSGKESITQVRSGNMLVQVRSGK